MPRSEIPVDLFNPGQVFACLGFMEAAETLLGEAAATFLWQDGAREARFILEAAGDEAPVLHVLRFLGEAEVFALAPKGSELVAKGGQGGAIATKIAQTHAYPMREPDSAATLVAVLRDAVGRTLAIDHWGDTTRRDAAKFWAGSGGYPGAALLRDALKLFCDGGADAAHDPFSQKGLQSSSFRFDWRRDYVPIDAGFSPNDHGAVRMTGYPIVEVLAAIGLSNARPARPDPKNKLRYTYGVLGSASLLAPMFLRAALGGAGPVPGRPFRRFAIILGWPGKEGQARVITDVRELT